MACLLNCMGLDSSIMFPLYSLSLIPTKSVLLSQDSLLKLLSCRQSPAAIDYCGVFKRIGALQFLFDGLIKWTQSSVK